ncbi:M24 family metallopeptidase [Mangrovibrevibacter kandeliae]|uniref:M24 family metallopeptidase n=1 Tax=Mangrovibrevibacter kandeliae TaxID=2968473 RepID=UPI002117D1FA|nr:MULTISPECIES: Xaa-Pro peptidase family protein [unclassified Aurantimonas]MCQ8781594.1 Xaa-Pro peptidase family protein [Aurantimonas sp. CSK15Z-1]MCW4114960.1 Xaa-Pro peptidase family protein [Aurantimonas sp. MSK8Z-1]
MIDLAQEHTGRTGSGRAVSLRFPEAEHRARIARTRAVLAERGLDALLVFAQESHYYLTGFDTAGYVFFQVGIVTAADELVLLTRTPDKRQAEVASLYDDVRIWLNAEDADPALDLRALLSELGLQGARLGVEFATHGLTAANGRAVEAALAGFAVLEDASDVIRRQRLVKSPLELDYVRAAGQLADAAVEATLAAAAPGVFDTALSGAAVTAMLAGGADMPSGGPLLNVGPRALFGRGIGGPRRIAETDQVLVELAASACRYHVVIEHTFAVGRVDPRQQRQMAVAIEALERIKAAAVPGERLGTLDDIHRRVLDTAGFAHARYAACGYALGCTFKPTWMDVPPMIYSGNPLLLEPGMVFFVHIMIPDATTGLAAGVGQTFAIREQGIVETFSALPLQLWQV